MRSLARSISALRCWRRSASFESPASQCQHGQALQGPRVVRLEFDQSGQFPPLGLTVAASSGQPERRAAISQGRTPSAEIRPTASQNRGPSSVATARSRQSPPDRGIVRPTVQAPAQPRFGVVKPAGQDCVPRSSQPDPIVLFGGRVKKDLPGVDGDGLGIVLPEILEQLTRVGGAAPCGDEHLAHLDVPTLQPEQSGDRAQERISISFWAVPRAFKSNDSAGAYRPRLISSDRLRLGGADEIRIRIRDPCPRGQGAVRSSQHLLALTQQKQNLSVPGPTLGQVRQALPGQAESTPVHRLVNLLELGTQPPDLHLAGRHRRQQRKPQHNTERQADPKQELTSEEQPHAQELETSNGAVSVFDSPCRTESARDRLSTSERPHSPSGERARTQIKP